MSKSRLHAVLGIGCAVVFAAHGDDWPQWRGAHRDGIWREKGLLTEFPKGGPKVLWRVPIGPGYCGPAVADGRLFVTDRIVDPEIEKAMRGTPKAEPKRDDGKTKAKPRFPNGLPGKERILCIDPANGKTIWSHEYDRPYRISYPEGPRATPTCHEGKVYTLGAMGDLICFDAKSGKILWSKDFVKAYKTKPPVWGWSSHPLVEGKLLICLVGGKGSAVVAFDKDTGDEVWKALTAEEVGYSPPTIVEAGKTRQLVVWLDATVASLDPATGKEHWKHAHPEDGVPQRPVVTIIAPTVVDDKLFVSEFYKGSLVLKLAADKPAADILWRSNGTDPTKPRDLNSIMAAPYVKDGHLYGVCGFGEFRCIEASTGKVVWESLKPATSGRKALFAHAFVVPYGDRCAIFNDQGELILATLAPKGYEEHGRAKLLEPTFHTRGRDVVWCHPAFAYKSAFLRNDKELIRVDLSAPK